MPDKKKKVNTKPNPSAFVQVASDGASINVKKGSARGKLAAKANKLMKMKEAGKKLLQSEKKIVSKYWNPTKKKKK